MSIVKGQGADVSIIYDHSVGQSKQLSEWFLKLAIMSIGQPYVTGTIMVGSSAN